MEYRIFLIFALIVFLGILIFLEYDKLMEGEIIHVSLIIFILIEIAMIFYIPESELLLYFPGMVILFLIISVILNYYFYFCKGMEYFCITYFEIFTVIAIMITIFLIVLTKKT